MVGLVAVQQFQVQIAPGFVGKSLKKLTRQAESKRAGHILSFFRWTDALLAEFIQPAPYQIGPPAEIYHAPRQAFVHGHVRLASEWITRIKAGPIPANSFLVTKRLNERLPKRKPTILNGVMSIYGKVTFTDQLQIHDGMFGEQRQHVIKERNPRANRRFARPINRNLQVNPGLFGIPPDFSAPFH